MVQTTVKIPNLKELQKRLDGKWLVQPEIETALDTISDRPLRVTKKVQGNLGIANNVVSKGRSMALSREITTTLNWPRTTGRSMRRKNVGYMRAMTPNVLRKAFDRMRARFNAAPL